MDNVFKRLGKWVVAAVVICAAVIVIGLGRGIVARAHLNLGYLMLVHALAPRAPSGMYALDQDETLTLSELAGISHAQHHFSRAMTLDPGLAFSAVPASAYAHSLLGHFKQAEAEWGLALQRADGRLQLTALAMGAFHHRRGQSALAERIWLEYGQDIPDYFVHRGDQLLDYPDRELALHYYQIAEHLRPGMPDLEMRIVLAGFRAGQEEMAWQKLTGLLQKMISEEFAIAVVRLHALVHQEFIWVLIAASDVLQERQDIQGAEFMLLEAQRVQPDPISFSRLGAFYCRHGRFPEGIDTLVKAKAYGSQHYALESRQQLSICYCRDGRGDDAMREAEELARMAPADSGFSAWPEILQRDWQQICKAHR
jgi:tetratricopeptide (TPR) repeat protein